jgi:hypothetical protein
MSEDQSSLLPDQALIQRLRNFLMRGQRPGAPTTASYSSADEEDEIPAPANFSANFESVPLGANNNFAMQRYNLGNENVSGGLNFVESSGRGGFTTISPMATARLGPVSAYGSYNLTSQNDDPRQKRRGQVNYGTNLSLIDLLKALQGDSDKPSSDIRAGINYSRLDKGVPSEISLGGSMPLLGGTLEGEISTDPRLKALQALITYRQQFPSYAE